MGRSAKGAAKVAPVADVAPVSGADRARGNRARLAQMASLEFADFKPAAEVLRVVEAVPTIFPWYDAVTGVGGHPISRFTLLHGPSNEGKTEFALGLGRSFLERDHFFGLIDAERTTTSTWIRKLLGDAADHPGFKALDVGTYEQVRGAVRDYCDRIANAREKGAIPPDTTALLVLDSIRKLVPKKLWDELAKATKADADDGKAKGRRGKAPPGIDGIGGRAGQIKAAMNAAWVDELIPLLANSRVAMVVIARETEDAEADPWDRRQWKIGGGSALYYEASLDLRISRAFVLDEKKQVAEDHRIDVWKTKVAEKEDSVPRAHYYSRIGKEPPFGFDTHRDYLMFGVDYGAVQQAGSWFKLADGAKLGHGVENAIAALRKDAGLYASLVRDCRAVIDRTRETSDLL